jgi:adenylate cyclase
VEFYRAMGEPEGALHYQAGIHTGVATLGNAGSATRKEFTAIGDSINLAHRLLENAKPGQIIISEDTYKHCQEQLDAPGSAVRVISLDQLMVKGKTQPTRIYQVCREEVPAPHA